VYSNEIKWADHLKERACYWRSKQHLPELLATVHQKPASAHMETTQVSMCFTFKQKVTRPYET
jgi:hypothetical protein